MSAGFVDKAEGLPWQRLLALGLAVYLGLLGIQYSYKANEANRSAFVRWRPQIQQLRQVNIWERYNYPNPPIMAMLLKGLAELKAPVGALCWFYLKVAMTMLAIAWVFRMVETPERIFPLWGKALAVLLSLRPIMGDLYHGNINLYILFLVVLALYAFTEGHDVAAGVVLALAIACKVTPALFVPYLLWKRAWKTVAACAVGLVLFLLVVPASYLGIERNQEDLTSWWHDMVQPYVVGGLVTTDHPNQSLPGLVFRLGSHSPSFYDKEGDALAYDNLCDVNPIVLRWLVKGCMGVFALLVVWTCRASTTERRGWRLPAEFSMVVLGMLLFSERTWKHHCVTLLLPFAVLTFYLAACRPARKMRWYLIASLTLVTVLMASTSTTLLGWREEAAKMAQVYGAYVWSYLILVAALIVVMRQPEPAMAMSGWLGKRAASIPASNTYTEVRHAS